MISADATYLEALRHSHESEVVVEAYEDGVSLGQLNVVGVDMTIDGTTEIQRSADIRVAVDPLTSESRDTLEAITTNAGEVVLKHGISFGGALVSPLVTIATMRVDEITWSLSGATRTLRCFDRSLLVQDYTLPTARPLNASYINLIQTMVNEAISGQPWYAGHTWELDPGISTLHGSTTPAAGKAFARGDNRLTKVQELAAAVDAWVVNDPDGSFRIGWAPGVGPDYEFLDPVWHFNQGSYGVLVNQEGSYSRREQYNAVGLEFTPAEDTGDWSGYIFLWDNDTNSPTYFDGGFGRKPTFMSEEWDHLPSATEAEAVARRKLYDHSGKTRAIRVTSVYNPLLLPGDKVTVDVEDGAGGWTTETHVIERLSYSFGDRASMDVEMRMYRLPGSYGITVNGVVPT